MKRTFTGLGLFTVLMGFILLTGVDVGKVKVGQFVFDAIILFFCAAASNEMLKVFKSKGYNPIIAPIFFYLAAIYPMVYFFGFSGYAITAGAAFIVAFSVFIFDSKLHLNDFLVTLLIMAYPLMPIALSLFMTTSYGMLPFLIAIGASMCADTFAYYLGTLFKGPKIFPKISPKKTWSGSICGIFGGILGSILVYLLFELANLPVNDSFRFTQELTHPILFYILIGAAIGVVSEIGDLAASRLKRELQIKDFSKAFGSHGGIMDRLDSIIFGIIFVAIVMAFLV